MSTSVSLSRLKDRDTHTTSSPLNLSGSTRLPSLSTDRNSPFASDQELETIKCALLSCRKEAKESDTAVSCNKCNRWLHHSCAGFNQTEYKSLTKEGKNQENLMWFCDGCLPQIRCFLQGVSIPKSETTSSEMFKKMDKLIEGFARLEKAMVAKENSIEDLIEEKVEKYLTDQSEREDRQHNLIFHNTPEAEAEEIEDRKEHDIDQVKGIFGNLEVTTLV